MPGSPATSPRTGAPRYSDADAVSFASQVNAVTDAFDAAVALAAQGEGNVTSKSAAYTAAAGDAVIATAALTLTLPTTPANGASVVVVAEGGAVTVQRGGSSDTITSYGTTGQTSISVPSGTATRLRFLSGVWHLVQAQSDAGAAVASLRTLGTGATQAAAGNDARLSDARTPTAHAASHEVGGADEILGITDAQIASGNKDGADGTASLRTLGATGGKAAGGDRVGWQGVARAGSFNALAGQMNYCTGAMTATLPTSPADDVECGIVSLTGTVTVNRGGGNTISELGLTGQTSTKVPAGTSVVYKYLAGVWYPVRDARPLASLTVARAYRNAALTPGNAAWVVIPLDATSFDPMGLWSTANGWYTAPYPGYYRISGQVSANYGAAKLDETCVAGFAVNGSLSVQGSAIGNTGTSASGLVVVTSTQLLAAGDHVQLALYTLNTPGAGLTVGSADQNYLSVERVA